MSDPINVLFVCVSNRGKSVMAERLSATVTDRIAASSAGTNAKIGGQVNGLSSQVLAEVGADAAEPRVRRPLSPLVPILGALAVVFAVIAILGLVRPGAPEVTNSAWVDTGATLEVTSAGRDALQTVFSYGFDTIDQDQEAARAVLNDERRGEYDSTAEQTKQGVLQTQTVTTATVTDIGVSLLDGDRAELVASMDIAARQDGVDQGTVQTPVAFTMERVDGKWLIATIDNR